MERLILNVIHRPEMVPEYAEKVTGQGKEEDIGRGALLTESLDIFRTQQAIAHKNGIRTTIQMTYASLFNDEAVALAKEHHAQYGDEIALVEINPEVHEKQRVTWKEYALIQPTSSVPYRREITWSVFDEKANRVANMLLSRGIRKGQKVAILLMNCLEWLPIYFGILKAGASPTPMHSSIMASRTVTQLRRGVPKAPSKMPSYTWKGFSLVTAKMKMPLTTRDSSTAMIRMAHALGRAMPSRLAMRSRGSLWVLPCVMPPSPPLQSGSSAGPLPLWWWCGRPQYR